MTNQIMQFDHLIDDLKISARREDGWCPIIHVQTEDLIRVLCALKSSNYGRFTVLTDLFGADFPYEDKRFVVVYNLLSLELNQRVVVKVAVSDIESVPSVTSIFSAACWYEREVFDMFGISFTGTHDLRRILTDYGFEGHPLRKDFPLSGYVQVKYDPSSESVVYEPVNLDHEYRSFSFESPWQYSCLPGDEKKTI
jgi:NADH-quinone oxidoreductase subunit C